MAKKGMGNSLDDPERLTVLHRSGLLNSSVEEAFDRLTRLAARILDTPIALVSLVDTERQFFKSQIGLPEPWAARRGTPLSHSFCQHTVTTGRPLVVEDARSHPLVSSSPGIDELGVVAYAGIPLTTPDGLVLGSFCVIDHKPRAWTTADLETLADLAASVMAEISLHTLAREAARQAERAIDARRRAESLAAERAAVLSQIKDGVIITDAEGRITFVNDEAGRLHGRAVLDVSVDDYAATYHLLTMSGDPYPPHEVPLARTVLQGATVIDALWRIQRADGAEVIAQGSTTPVVADDGHRLGSVLVLRDVTAQHNLEREKEDFLAAAAHDLKNPLISINGTAQLLQRQLARPGGVDLPRLTRGLQTITTSSTAMADLVDELLDVTRAEMGHTEALYRVRSDLVTLAHQAADRYRHTSERHRITVAAEAPELVVWCDVTRLERVLGNLLSNAIKYSPLGGDVVISLRADEGEAGRWAVVSIADQGMGIPEADVPHVFDRFRRGSNVVGRIAGTGIGLAAARQTVELHGGHIAVTSREGAGTTMTVRLPLGDI